MQRENMRGVSFPFLLAMSLGLALGCGTVRKGDRGACVAQVQQAVGVTADGIFGPNTETAVKAFQRSHGLTADGIVGPNTWNAIQGDGSSSGETGKAAVESAIAKLNEAGIFPADHGFLKRVAWVESKFGSGFERINKFRRNGGMWQVDPIGLEDVQLRLPAAKKNAIKSKLGVNVDGLNRSSGDLQTPLNGLVVARSLIYVKTSSGIPSDLDGQARYWKKYYNTEAGAGTVEKFLSDVRSMP